MEKITITSDNIKDCPWIWDFLEEQRKSARCIWKPNQIFTFNGARLQFQDLIFVRERKKNGFAYEICSKQCLGRGAFGSIYRIYCTISQGKTGQFQITDKKRVAKFQDPHEAQNEYLVARYAAHLHVKKPVAGWMVMREMRGITLSSFLNRNKLSREDLLELTQELLQVYKEQVADKKLRHNDLHLGNILIAPALTPEKKYEFNIIDFGIANYFNSLQEPYRYGDLSSMLKRLWSKHHNLPQILVNITQGTHPIPADCTQLLTDVIFAPTPETQKPLDTLVNFLLSLSATQKELAEELKDKVKNAVKQSSPNCMEPLKNVVLHCKALFPQVKNLTPIFHTHPKKQNAFNQLFIFFEQLERKGAHLKKWHQDGEALCQLAAALREKTFNAAYQNESQQSMALNECGQMCKQMLKENQHLLNIHQNSDYIWAEIGMIFLSLIVLYPLAAGINYLATGRIGFFSQTRTAAQAEKINSYFNTLSSK